MTNSECIAAQKDQESFPVSILNRLLSFKWKGTQKQEIRNFPIPSIDDISIAFVE